MNTQTNGRVAALTNYTLLFCLSFHPEEDTGVRSSDYPSLNCCIFFPFPRFFIQTRRTVFTRAIEAVSCIGRTATYSESSAVMYMQLLPASGKMRGFSSIPKANHCGLSRVYLSYS